ncbi:hypothetical protein [Nocardia sp. NPDC051981]|uniref:hypothetical protein n=1 Tax=Nocardia sp. NPDC051981 TaxID=3155417 RepID=UPI00342EFBF4
MAVEQGFEEIENPARGRVVGCLGAGSWSVVVIDWNRLMVFERFMHTCFDAVRDGAARPGARAPRARS